MRGDDRILPADFRIGFVGAGRMAGALVKGIGGSDEFGSADVAFTDPNDQASKAFLQTHPSAIKRPDLESLASGSDLIVLAIKPQSMSGVLQELSPWINEFHLVVSVAAGVTVGRIQEMLNTDRVIRVMPNTPCLIGAGMSAMSSHDSVSRADQQTVQGILQSMGKVVIVPESSLDAVTGLSGSGPAYVFTFIKALIDAGVKAGLSAGVSRTLALQTIAGSVALAEHSDDSPLELRRQVTSPGGTTEAGLGVLDRERFAESVIQAVAAATERSIELSRV